MTRRAIAKVTAGFLLLATPVMAAEIAGRTEFRLPPQARRGPRRARCNPRSHRTGAGASDGGEGQSRS